ncbi:MAG: prepilin peptidase [Candidatus Omnitrophota bacterium]|jgi:leader peptidase (prepilin peptidase)/N-methyltransferase|nr:prepilin peptidase [Candidatus Omnitrophota bacterium]
MINVAVFIFGSIVGSFLNVCIYRLPKGRSVIVPGSHCPNCTAAIHWYDNVPILSYIFLGGRARCCKAKISLRYFIVEVLTASAFLILFSVFGLTPKFFAYAIMVSGLIIATFVDFEIQEIPDEVSIGGLAVGLILAVIFPSVLGETARFNSFLNSFLGALAGGGMIYAMGMIGEFAFKKEAMGGGDVKLLAMIGAFIGWKLTILTFFLAPVFGSVVGIILKIRYGKDVIPYGPYLSLAAVCSIFFGERIINLLTYGVY